MKKAVRIDFFFKLSRLRHEAIMSHPFDINNSKGGHVRRFFWSNALRTKRDGLPRPAAITDLSTVLARGIPNSKSPVTPITVSISNGLIQRSLNIEIRTNGFCFTDSICLPFLMPGP